MIRADTIYTLPEFRKETGMAETAVSAARRRGLRIRYAHTRGFILGSDFIEYLERNAKTSQE